MKSSFYGILTVFLVFASVSFSAPEPAVVQGPGLWTLKTMFTHPQQIVLMRDEDDKPVRFWYMIITITNNSGRDVDFYPKCDMVTDTFQITTAGQNVGTAVFNRIKERHKSEYPFLELLGKTDNKVLQGQDNTKDIAIIWSDFDKDAKNIDIFITGLSNETAELEYPLTKEENSESSKVYLRKTLQIKYNVRGDPSSPAGASLEYKGKTWVMR